MKKQQKFGTFSGVFTPSILTILGVIMYLRLGWVVGNAGLEWALIIIGISHIISITTGLSISSIATDKKVGAGGVYYVLSRSLGLPIGGALGITLFIATAFSIALYMVGFAESFNKIFEFGYIHNEAGQLVEDADNFKNAIRVTALAGLLFLTIIAFISTSIAIKTQYIILTLIALSIGAIFLGQPELAKQIEGISTEKIGLIEIFAVFFPAVTGFTAGVAMSGDLKDPKKSIPYGTMIAIGVGLIVYVSLTVFFYLNFSESTLINNKNFLYEATAFGGVFVLGGVWGATLSSAIGGILGGPRILQAMSVDKITPQLFAKGVGQDNEPRNALLLTVIIAAAGILIGELNVIAEVVSMFYLAAYGFINLSFFLESWASSDFNPTFKVRKWVGLVGFLATFMVMFQLNMLAMFAAFIIIGGIYFFLNKRQVSLGTGDIWQSVWSTIVKKGLRKMEVGNDHKRNWTPNLLLFSGGTENRPRLIEFSKSIAGQNGIITNFDLILDEDAKVLFPKHKQTVKDEELDKFGIFGRRIEVQNEFKGIESIATTFGFSGIEPNTTLIPWPGETKDPIWFAQMTQKLFDLDFNVLYLDYDKRWGFRKKEKIDLWWRNVGNNAELMLSLTRFLKNSSEWAKASARILLVNEGNVDNSILEQKIKEILEPFRFQAEIKIVNNLVDKKPLYELMKLHSAEADLVFVGIPDIEHGQEKEFVEHTNTLVNTIGTTLLVKASSQFEEKNLKVDTIEIDVKDKDLDEVELIQLAPTNSTDLTESLSLIDQKLDQLTQHFIKDSIQPIENFHHTLIKENIRIISGFLTDLPEDEVQPIEKIHELTKKLNANFTDFCEYKLPLIFEEFSVSYPDFLKNRDQILAKTPFKLEVDNLTDNQGNPVKKKNRINFNQLIEEAWINKGLLDYKNTLLEFGYQNFILIHQSKLAIHKILWNFIEDINAQRSIDYCTSHCKKELQNELNKIDETSLNLTEEFYKLSRNVERNLLNELGKSLGYVYYKPKFKEAFSPLHQKDLQAIHQLIDNFPIYWKRNILLFTFHVQVDLYLLDFNTDVETKLHQIANLDTEEYVNSINRSIDHFEKEVNTLIQLTQEENTNELNGYYFSFSDDFYFDPEQLINQFDEDLQNFLEHLPNEVDLLDADSLNQIKEEQTDKVKTINIELQDITDYITKTSLIKPLNDTLVNHLEQLKRVTGILLNSSFHIHANLEKAFKSNKFTELKQSLAYAKNEVTEARSLLNSVQSEFNYELKVIKNKFNRELDINNIIREYDRLNQSVKKDKKRWLNDIESGTYKLQSKLQSVFSKVLQSTQEAEHQQYQEKFSEVISGPSVFLDFMDSISVNQKVSDALPFYYQQLFTGKHISDTQTLDNRKTEILLIKKAIHRIDLGVSGAILITGESASGKSFLANHTVNQLIKGKVYRINPNKAQVNTKQHLANAFKQACGIDESIQKILNQTEAKSVFLFENIEQWWLKTEGGSAVLNEINKLVDKFGTKHYFIFTANVYAYKALKNTTSIPSNIIESVILPPLSLKDLTTVVLKRHKTGGMDLVYDGFEEKFMSIGQKEKMISKIYQSSSGNIGLALRQWIANIDRIEENKIYIDQIQSVQIPNLPNENWRNVLYQMQIHGLLNRTELYKIYGESNKSWLNQTIASLLKSGLLKTVEKNTFEINPIVKPYIEHLLYAENG